MKPFIRSWQDGHINTAKIVRTSVQKHGPQPRDVSYWAHMEDGEQIRIQETEMDHMTGVIVPAGSADTAIAVSLYKDAAPTTRLIKIVAWCVESYGVYAILSDNDVRDCGNVCIGTLNPDGTVTDDYGDWYDSTGTFVEAVAKDNQDKAA